MVSQEIMKNPSLDGFNIVVRQTNKEGKTETVPVHIVQWRMDRTSSRRVFLRQLAQERQQRINKQTEWTYKLNVAKLSPQLQQAITSVRMSVPTNVPFQICDKCRHNIRFCKCYRWRNKGARFTPR